MHKREMLRTGPVRQDLRVGRLSGAVTHRLEEWLSSPGQTGWTKFGLQAAH